jgi:hypothetical protein
MAQKMLENAAVQATPMPRRRQRPRLPTDAQARRVEELRRAFQRLLNRRPTLIEKATMLRAAALVARAEALALDPSADVNELVKLNNLASRALRLLGIKVEQPPAKASRVLAVRRERWAAQEQQAKAAQTAREAAQSNTMMEQPPDGPAE